MIETRNRNSQPKSRVSNRSRESDLIKLLEADSRSIVTTSKPSTWSVTDTIRREIALVLSHIDRENQLNEELKRNLLRVECYVCTELTQMEQRTPRYSPYRFPEREKLQRRLMQLEQERRKLCVDHNERMKNLHDRLLKLVNKHTQLNI